MNHDYPVRILGTVYAAYQKRGQVKNKHKRKDLFVPEEDNRKGLYVIGMYLFLKSGL